jgi:hypothetical protein
LYIAGSANAGNQRDYAALHEHNFSQAALRVPESNNSFHDWYYGIRPVQFPATNHSKNNPGTLIHPPEVKLFETPPDQFP